MNKYYYRVVGEHMVEANNQDEADDYMMNINFNEIDFEYDLIDSVEDEEDEDE
jgi:hypothetical protein